MLLKQLAVTIITMTVLSWQINCHSSETHWGYEGETGPDNWGNLKAKYALCANGKQQSPIDIMNSVKAALPKLGFNYNSVSLAIKNNGHTIKMPVDKAGTLEVGDNSYKLLQFHTHTPSEGAINGERFDMVVHLVHKNAQGNLAVVAVLLKKGATANPLLASLWKVMPKTVGEAQHYVNVQMDIEQLLPKDKSYYTYTGSLTTPPCSEGVKWIVLKQPMSISAEQLAQYQAVYPHNARPLQPQNNRKILSSD